MFEPLKDPAAFAKVRIDPAFGVLEWPNGADLAPEFTYTGSSSGAMKIAETGADERLKWPG